MDSAGNDKSQECVGLGLFVFFFSSFALKIIGKEIERKEERENNNVQMQIIWLSIYKFYFYGHMYMHEILLINGRMKNELIVNKAYKQILISVSKNITNRKGREIIRDKSV